jgi:hypothetical protein
MPFRPLFYYFERHFFAHAVMLLGSCRVSPVSR